MDRTPDLDRDLAHLPEAERWRIWMRRLEAVLFASPEPVARDRLARVVGARAPLELLLADLAADLADRPYALRRVGGAWALRTRPAFGPAIRAALSPTSAPGPDNPPLDPADLAILAVVAWHQPVTRAGIAGTLGTPPGHDRLARLRAAGLIAHGPRSPSPGAPRAWVTTEAFLDRFGLESLQDLPEPVPERDTDLDAGPVADPDGDPDTGPPPRPPSR